MHATVPDQAQGHPSRSGWWDWRPTLATRVVVIILMFLAAAMALTLVFETNAPLAVATAAIGAVTFFGAFGIFGADPIPAKDRMRNAITAAFVVVYLVLLGLLAFRGAQPGATAAPELSKTLVTNFTFLMGVVIAFYFGSTTYERVKGVEESRPAPSGTSPHAPSPPGHAPTAHQAKPPV